MPMEPLNLGRLQQWIDAGRIDPSRVITMKDLLDSRAIHDIRFGVKLLADVGVHSCVHRRERRTSTLPFAST